LGVDFGDRQSHPTQLYDMIALGVLVVALAIFMRRPRPNGRLFRAFLPLYLSYRFSIECLKPSFKPWLGLSAIQIACVLASIWCGK
jgi:phosphatidylglycerol---prolipoprotein diacylglyceryl transferase